MPKILKHFIIFALISGVIYGGLTLYKKTGLPAEINDIATQFFQSLSEKDFDTAFSRMSSEFHENPPEDLDQFKENLALLFDQYEFQGAEQTEFSFNVSEEESTYDYAGYIVFADGSAGDTFIFFVKEGEEWKILNFEISTPY